MERAAYGPGEEKRGKMSVRSPFMPERPGVTQVLQQVVERHVPSLERLD